MISHTGRHLYRLTTRGCFFLCLGGWVCSGHVSAADLANQARETILNQAVAQAAATEPGTPAPEAADPIMPPPMPGAVPPSSTAKETTNLKEPVTSVAPDGSLEQFSVQDLDITTALHFLSLQSKRNIIPSKDVKGNVTVNLYNVSFREALDVILTQNDCGYIERGSFIYVYTNKQLTEIRKRERKKVNKIFHLRYITAADAAILIKPLQSADGVAALTPPAVGGIPSGTDTGGEAYATNDLIVVNDYAENIADIEKTLASLDVRPQQVLIEATILSATLKDDNHLGVDFVGLAGSGLDFGSLASAATGGTVPTGSAFAGKVVPAAGGTQTNAGTDFTSKLPSGGLSVGFLSNNISIYLKALEETTDTTIVANPKILALNKHRGEVFIGNEDGYSTTTTNSSGTSTQNTEFLKSGTRLIFRPFITDDKFVRLEIHPEDSIGTVDPSTKLPSKTTTELTTNIMVKEGRTVVLGGLFRTKQEVGRGQVPILGNIPVLGLPFRRQSDTNLRTETVVLMTPHIIRENSSIYDEADKTAVDVQRRALGTRQGMMPWGRDRVAQTWYRKAAEAHERGDNEKAIMYTDWAINTNPNLMEANKLREELTGKRFREVDDTITGDFVRKVIRNDEPEASADAAPTTQPK